ncbi:MAG: hypothetical protein U0228_32980 [Myxococcaceae bacterium]
MLRDMLQEAGPFGVLAAGIGALTSLFSIVPFFLSRGSTGGKVLGGLVAFGALVTLALGGIGYAFGRIAIDRAMGNVPYEMKAALLYKGTLEIRQSLLLGLLGSAVPLLASFAVAFFHRARAIAVLAGIFVLVWAGELAVWNKPLPPSETVYPLLPGVELPRADSQRRPRLEPVVSITPKGVFVAAEPVTPEVAAKDPRIEDGSTGPHPIVATPLAGEPERRLPLDAVPLMVDARTPLSALLDVTDAFDRAPRPVHAFDLLVKNDEDLVSVLRFVTRAGAAEKPDGLELTLVVKPTEVLLGTKIATLDPLPVDWSAVRGKLVEIRSAFPSDDVRLHVTAPPDTPVGTLVRALDAARQTSDHRVLYPEPVLVRERRQ